MEKSLAFWSMLRYNPSFRWPPKWRLSETVHFQGQKMFRNATDLHPEDWLRHLRFALKLTAAAVLEDKNVTVTFDRHLPLDERILRIDHIQARRYSKLGGVALEIATQGILRHLRACDRMDVNPDTSAVREIIDDALNGRRVFAETAEQETQAA
jgi:hypothetical protein